MPGHARPARPTLDGPGDRHARRGPQRFGRIRDRLEGVSPKVLTQTLRRLEDKGLLTRTVYAEVPARVEYELTDLGRGAAVPLRSLRTWAEENTPV